MTLSTAAKAGVGGTVATAGSGIAATYAAWNYITLYAVEREVINNDLRLTATRSDGENKKITIKAPDKNTSEQTEPKLSGDNSWSCEITTQAKDDDLSNSNLEKYIQSHLQISEQDISDEQRSNKVLLVKACSKIRQDKPEAPTNTKVVGTLKIKKGGNSYKFEEHSHLDFLLKPNTSLYEVEQKIVKEKLGLTVTVESGTATAKIKTTSSDWADNAGKYYWECEIKSPTNAMPEQNKWSEKLFAGDSGSSTQEKLDNNKKLIEKCSKSRKTESTGKRVKSSLDLSSKSTEINSKEKFWVEILGKS